MAEPDYSAHEALHTAYIMMDMVNRHLLEHSYVEKNEELRDIVERASDALFEAYQWIGAKHAGSEDK